MKNKPYYGFPLSYIIFRIIFLILIVLIFIGLLFNEVSIYIFLILFLIVISIIFYFFVIQFKKNFLLKRRRLLNKIIDLADIRGNEKVLDIGTGSGFLAIGISKVLSEGKTVGLDRYSLKKEDLKTKIKNTIKINFFGNTLINAKENVKIERVADKCKFIESDITEPLDFNNNYFDLIVSSQLFYCINKSSRPHVFKELNRVLKKGGKIIFFESKSFLNWNIFEVKDFFEKEGYKIDILQSTDFKKCCILYGVKLEKNK